MNRGNEGDYEEHGGAAVAADDDDAYNNVCIFDVHMNIY